MTNYYNQSKDDSIKSLNSSIYGLNTEEAKARLEKYGPNELKKENKSSPLKLFLSQFTNALSLLLVFAGGLSLFIGEIVESIAIFVIILINSVLGFIQEYRADKAIEALKKISAPKAIVIRDGEKKCIPASQIVVGDILVIEAGDIIAADCRLIEAFSLKIDEASLTGESVPASKIIDTIKKEVTISSQNNMIFMGTIATYGKGKGVVTSVGMDTEFGKIAHSLQETEETKTPLLVKFEKLARQIGVITLILVGLVFIIGYAQGKPLNEMILLALALTVSTIPNSLPLVVTVGLSMGTKKLAEKNMLVKKLPAAESLGAVTIICSDKTGTITKNEMTVTDIYFDSKEIRVTGTGYKPVGEFFVGKEKIKNEKLELLLKIGYLCNNAELVKNNDKYGIIGDPTEGSLLVLGEKGGLNDQIFEERYKEVGELPFDSDRKRMSVIFQDMKTKKYEAYVKGAPDMLLEKCDRIYDNGKVRKITSKDKENYIKFNHRFAERALRVLGFAYKEVKLSKEYNIDEVEKDLVFVGIVGMIDPPRDEVKLAIQQCKDASIGIMIITGDHPLTTKAIAKQIGIFKDGDEILTGDDLNRMSDKELDKVIDKVRIIARVLPIQKSRIVDILRHKGHIVAMTGDGVNDAPALKKADIGIAMGITGTDVAKEAAKGTLTDDNFATIVVAIEEGRNIYNKLIRSAKFFLSCNMGEITTVLIAIMTNCPLALLPLQLLLMNMLTDNLPALGLGMESGEEGIMKRPPRNPKEQPITIRMFFLIILFGLIMGLGAFYMFYQYKDIDLPKAQTIAFTTLVMFQMFAVLSSRSLYFSLKKLNPFTNLWLLGSIVISISIQCIVIYWEPLQGIFGTVALSWNDWTKILLISSLGFIMMEISKFFVGKKDNINPVNDFLSK